VRAIIVTITYGTNNEFGFDYLRDNMVIRKEEMVQRDLNFCIIDEVDSILIDEARTPLIISGEGEKTTDLYSKADSFVQTLTGKVQDPDQKKLKNWISLWVDIDDDETVDYLVDEKGKTSNINSKRYTKAEDI